MRFEDGENDIIFSFRHIRKGKKEFKRVFGNLTGGRIDMHQDVVDMRQVLFDITRRLVVLM